MSSWFVPSAYRTVPLLLVMALCAVTLAWNTIDLAQIAMANVRFIRTYGAMALADGGLLQLLEIVVRGIVSLAAYLGFKACEVELVHRWRSAGS